MKTRSVLQTLKTALIAGSVLGGVAAPAAARGTDAKSAPPSVQQTREADPAALNEQGLALYGAGDYRHALEKFIEAHALASDPNLLFNMGRCYEQLDQREAALEKYELFLGTPGGDPAGLERARAASARLRARGGKVQRRPATAGGERGSVSSIAVTPAWVPWATLGSGAAFVAAGATFYAWGAHDHARVTGLPEYGRPDVPAGMTWRRANALVRSGDTKKLVGGISLGLGGAAAAAALALLFTEDHAEPRPASLEVEPTALRGGGGLVVAGSFR